MTGRPTDWFPCRKNRVQRLFVVSGGEAETIYGNVKVEFDERHSLPNCFPYAPPRVNVSLYGKGHRSRRRRGRGETASASRRWLRSSWASSAAATRTAWS